MTPQELVQHVLTHHARAGAFEPFAYYDPDGDCIEFFVSDEPFLAERVDEWVTVYHGEQSGEIIGSLLKGVASLLKQYPGLAIDIECGHVRLSHILRARAWSIGDELVRRSYKKVIEVAEERSITTDLQPA